MRARQNVRVKRREHSDTIAANRIHSHSDLPAGTMVNMTTNYSATNEDQLDAQEPARVGMGVIAMSPITNSSNSESDKNMYSLTESDSARARGPGLGP